MNQLLGEDELLCMVRAKLQNRSDSALDRVWWCCAFAGVCRDSRSAVAFGVAFEVNLLLCTLLDRVRVSDLTNALALVQFLACHKDMLPKQYNRQLATDCVQILVSDLQWCACTDYERLLRAVLLMFSENHDLPHIICNHELFWKHVGNTGRLRAVTEESTSELIFRKLFNNPQFIMGNTAADTPAIKKLREELQIDMYRRCLWGICNADKREKFRVETIFVYYVCQGSDWCFLETLCSTSTPEPLPILRVMRLVRDVHIRYFRHSRVSVRFILHLINTGATHDDTTIVALKLLLSEKLEITTHNFLQIVETLQELCVKDFCFCNTAVDVFIHFRISYKRSIPARFVKTVLRIYMGSAPEGRACLDTHSKTHLVNALPASELDFTVDVMLHESNKQHVDKFLLIVCAQRLIKCKMFTEVLLLMKRTLHSSVIQRHTVQQRSRTLVTTFRDILLPRRKLIKKPKDIAILYTIYNLYKCCQTFSRVSVTEQKFIKGDRTFTRKAAALRGSEPL